MRLHRVIALGVGESGVEVKEFLKRLPDCFSRMTMVKFCGEFHVIVSCFADWFFPQLSSSQCMFADHLLLQL